MKILSILALMIPLVSFGAEVNIDGISLNGQNSSANGTAVYDTSDTLTVARDGQVVSTQTNVSPWSASFNAGAVGNHTLTATVSEANGNNPTTVSKNYIVPGGGTVLLPLENYCWGLFGDAWHKCREVKYTRLIPAGTEDCPRFINMGCKGFAKVELSFTQTNMFDTLLSVGADTKLAYNAVKLMR